MLRGIGLSVRSGLCGRGARLPFVIREYGCNGMLHGFCQCVCGGVHRLLRCVERCHDRKRRFISVGNVSVRKQIRFFGVADFPRQRVFVRNGVVAAPPRFRSERRRAADVRAVAQRELHAHHVAVGEVTIRKSDIRKDVVDRVHPPRTVGKREFPKVALAVLRIVVRVKIGHGLPQIRLQQVGNFGSQPQPARDCGQVTAAVVVISLPRRRTVRNVGKIEGFLHAPTVVADKAVFREQAQQLFRRSLALPDRHLGRCDQIAAPDGKQFHAPDCPADLLARLCGKVGDLIGQLRALSTVRRGGDRYKVLPLFGKVQRIACLFVVIPSRLQNLAVVADGCADLFAARISCPDVKGLSAPALNGMVGQRGAQGRSGQRRRGNRKEQTEQKRQTAPERRQTKSFFHHLIFSSHLSVPEVVLMLPNRSEKHHNACSKQNQNHRFANQNCQQHG